MNALGTNKLRDARKRAGLTQAELSSIAGVKKKTWERWEASPGASNSSRIPEYAFKFLRCYEILKKHNLLDEFLNSDK